MKPLLFILIITLSRVCLYGQSSDTTYLVFGNRSSLQTRDEFELKGLITDLSTKDTLVSALIRVSGSEATVTNDQGIYRLVLRAGRYKLQVSSLGFLDKFYVIDLFQSGVLNIKLEEKSINLSQIEVSASKVDRIRDVIGLEQLDVSRLERQARFLGETDVFRSLQSITGVSSIGEGSSGINVRGGNTDENLVLQDQHLIINPTHALGIFSITHPDLLESVSLYKGNMPSKYGGRLSSVLDIRLKEGSMQNYKGTIGLGIASSKISLEGPLIKDKISFISGFRGSYLDPLLDLSKNVSLEKSSALFYDGTLKIDARLSGKTKAGISLVSALDNFRFSDEVKFDYNTRSAAAYINHLISSRINLNLTFNRGTYRSNLFDIKSNDQSSFRTQVDFTRFIVNFQMQVNTRYFFESGLEINRYIVLPGAIRPFGTGSAIGEFELSNEQSREINLFIQNKLRLSAKLDLEFGLRQTLYQNIGPGVVYLYPEGRPKTELNILDSLMFQRGEPIKSYSGFEPRIAFNFHWNAFQSIKGGYSRNFQYLNQLSNTSSASPTDLWQLSNYHISPQQADQFSIGYYHRLETRKIEYYFSIYYKRIRDLIDFRDFAVVLLNAHIETDLLRGKGKAYGFEAYFSKQTEKSSIEWSYTYSRTLRSIPGTMDQESVNQGKWYPSNYDKPHVLNINYFLQLTGKTSLSMNFTYSTGRPTSAPIGVFNQENLYDIPIYSSRNQFRIPDYHRLDLAFSIGPWGNKTFSHSLVFSVYNVYSRNNAYSVFFRQNAFLQTSTYRISVLGAAFPSLTYQLKFES